MFKRRLFVATVSVAALVLFAGLVFADSLAIDFESYTVGTVDGQDGWSSDGAAGSGCAVYDHAIVDSTSYSYGSFGTRSLRMSNAVTSGCFGDQTFSKSLGDEAGETSAVSDGLSGGTRQPYFEAQWDFASTLPGSEQAGLSVVASPDRGDGARMSWVQMADTPSGLEVNFYDYQESAIPAVCDDNDFVFTNLAGGLDRTALHTIKIQMYWVDGSANDVVRVYVDGLLEHTGTSWEDYFRNCESNPTRPVDSILFRTGGTAAPATASNGFLIDNLTLVSGPVTQCTTDCYVDVVNGNDAFGGTNPTTDAKQTIQAGIDTVSPGGTVHVLPGTYNESPNITKSLTLQSTGGRDVTEIVLQAGPTYLGSLTVNGTVVTVDGFTIVGFDAVGSGLASTNLYVTGTPNTVTIQNNRIQVGAIGSGSNGDDGFGLITTYSETSDVDTVNVVNNIFEPVNASGARAFYINPGVDNFLFKDNTVTGNFTQLSITQAKHGLVEENTMTGAGASAGLGAWGYPDPTVYGRTTFRANTIAATAGAINVIETENVLIEQNVLSGNDRAVRVRQSVPLPFDPATIAIHNNDLSGNTTLAVSNEVVGVVDASANWYGTNIPAGVAAQVSADVDYTPWLNSGTDTSGAAGFQGDFSYLNVDDDSPQTGATGRIQEGVDLVTASTVNVAAGTYNEHVVIDVVALNLLGANAGVDARGARGPESIIDGGLTDAPLQIVANDVAVDGFTIKGGSNGLNAGIHIPIGAASGYDILNNIITDNAIGIYANCAGSCLIRHNLFDANNQPGPAGGSAIYSESTSGLVVDENEVKNHTTNSPVIFAGIASPSHVNVTFTENALHDNLSGVFALAVSGGDFSRNEISTLPAATGITFGGGSSNVDVLNNKLDNNLRGLRIADFGYGFGTNSAITAHENSVANDSEYGVGVLTGGYTGALDAEKNWWGSATGPTHASNPGGAGSPATDDVDFNPWLCDGTDTSTDIGFQPNVSSLCSIPGSLTVTKTVNWGSATPNPAQTFEICIAGPSYPGGNCQTIDYDGGMLTWSNLQPGDYTITETDPGASWVVSISGSPATVTSGGAANASVTNTLVQAGIAIDKQGPVIASGGGPVTYNYQVTNPGTVPLSNVSVTDNRCSPVSYFSGDADTDNQLDPGETWLFTCTYTPVFNPLNKLTNTATAKGKYNAQTVSATDNFTLYPFTLLKKVFLYWDSKHNTIAYSQPDNTPFTVEVYKNNALVGTYTISQNAPQKLWLSAGSYTFKEINLPPGYLAGYSSFQFTTGHGYPSWTFPNVITFDLTIDKTGPATARKGSTITYTYRVTNAGPAAVKPKVTDNKCSPVTYVSGDTDHDQRIDAGEVWNFQCRYKVTQSLNSYITNKATVADSQRPTKGSFIGGDRNRNDDSDTWTLRVVR
ncbi:MAG TPA: right-handed parallel beta-helix repeat-containing protein [Anaerolineae bacterium]|nr:right-handed parallel beta-helix repeat-containing protein [Anaerolineae bacterium]